MKSTNRFLSRRSVVTGALLAPSMALAKPATGKTAAAKPWSNEYWAQKGDVKLYMFRKRAIAPSVSTWRRPAAANIR